MASYFKLASIHRHPNSRYWYCCINIPGRGQLQRTTKQTNPRKTYEFAQKLEQAARANVLTEIQARKILAEIYEIKNAGERLPGSSVKDYFESWANNKARETARDHVITTMIQHRCDVKHELERKGTPFSLVLTKTTGSFERATKRFEADRRLLRILEEVSKGVAPAKGK